MYKSNRPTKEKRRLHEFMERHKKGGVVGINKLRGYFKQKGFHAVYSGTSKTASSGYGKKSSIYWMDIKSKRRTIAKLGIKHKKRPRVVWWRIK